MARAWIGDGLDLKAKIKPDLMPELEGEPVEIEITYRPPESDVLLAFEDSQQLPGPARVIALYDFVAKHVTGWTVQDDKGQTPKPTVENLKRVLPDYVVSMAWEIRNGIRKLGYVVKN